MYGSWSATWPCHKLPKSVHQNSYPLFFSLTMMSYEFLKVFYDRCQLILSSINQFTDYLHIHLTSCLSDYLSTFLMTTRLIFYFFFWLLVFFFLSTSQPINMFTCLSIHLFVYLSVYLSIRQNINMPACLLVYLYTFHPKASCKNFSIFDSIIIWFEYNFQNFQVLLSKCSTIQMSYSPNVLMSKCFTVQNVLLCKCFSVHVCSKSHAYLSICLLVYLSVCLPDLLPISLPIYLSIYISVYLLLHMFN